MAFLKTLPDADLKRAFRMQPDISVPMLEYHQALLRGPSPFTVGERELIAAYTSGLNNCDFCYDEHGAVAEAFGISEGLLGALIENLDTADVSDKMRPVLRFVGKLTTTPARMVQADADAVFAAGWDDIALYHAVSVCALFAHDNRMVQGLGIPAQDAASLSATVDRLHDGGYASTVRYVKSEADEKGAAIAD
jgi:uncharacterized peroxidase-related enzyme